LFECYHIRQEIYLAKSYSYAKEIKMTEEKAVEHEKKAVTIYINGTAKQVHKERLSYEEIVSLAFSTPPGGENVQVTVQYSRGHSSKLKGTLVEGQSVEIKEGMEFDVTATNRS
jgi:hypothetical protein